MSGSLLTCQHHHKHIFGGHNWFYLCTADALYAAQAFRLVFSRPKQFIRLVYIYAHKPNIVSYMKYSLRSGRPFQSHDLTIL
jgi:hypothetical protein